jgi:Zn-dependent protease with chaperone function/type II secretory pathway pseudopilin PulG
MEELVYPRERTLGTLTLVLGLIGWVALIAGTFGGALIGLAFGFLVYLFAHSTLIAHIKGNGVQLTEQQFPGLYAQFIECCEKLGIAKPPQAYILNGNGALNAFATKFLGTEYVVLLSDVVDAMDEHPEGVRFYFGHELGHLRRKHFTGAMLRWPVLWLPLLGAAYSRARESTCDRHGRACCASAEGAARALAALATGGKQSPTLDLRGYVDQMKYTSGFWMSFHELTAGYPWLTKRVARVMDPAAAIPGRSPMAYALGVIVPYAGRLGGGFGLLVLVYIIGVLAAIALPAYQDYTKRAQAANAIAQTVFVREKLAQYYESKHEVPAHLSDIDVPEVNVSPDVPSLELNSSTMVLTVGSKVGPIVFVPEVSEGNHVTWKCQAGDGTNVQHLPALCRQRIENQ